MPFIYSNFQSTKPQYNIACILSSMAATFRFRQTAKNYILLCSWLSRTDFVPMQIRTTQPVIFRACKKAKERANRVSGLSCLLKPFVSWLHCKGTHYFLFMQAFRQKISENRRKSLKWLQKAWKIDSKVKYSNKDNE